MHNSIAELRDLFSQNSKHSNYQILSRRLAELLDGEEMEIHSRFEKERLIYFLSKYNPTGKTIMDIGGNSGFFTFEMLDNRAQKSIIIEGNQAHSQFVAKAAEVLELTDKVDIHNRYFNFDTDASQFKVDLVLLLNVLHHLGDDFGDSAIEMEQAKTEMLQALNNMAGCTTHMFFQLGFCWKGDRTRQLFEGGTKREMIDFISKAIVNFWEIEEVAVAVKNKEGEIFYTPLDESNVERQDELGEFLNRPIFFLKSKVSQ